MKTILLVKLVLLTGAAIMITLVQVGKWTDQPPLPKMCPTCPEPPCDIWPWPDGCS